MGSIGDILGKYGANMGEIQGKYMGHTEKIP